MPYSISSPNLPEYVKKLSDKLRAGWIAVFNSSYEKYGEKEAFMMANAWLKKQTPVKKLVKRSVITLSLDTSAGFIKRSHSGDEYVTFVLNSTDAHRDGKKFSEAMLKKWAKTINENPTMVGDIDHLLYDKVLDSNLSNETAKSIIKNKPGIARMVKAIYDNGKLWVRAIIDKRYRKLVEKSKGVSAEAFCEWDETETVALDGDLLGFSFNVNTTPADYSAVVVQ